MSPDAFYGKRQGTLENNSEWRTARRIEVSYSMFATPFSIRCAVSYLFFPMFSIQGSLFNVRRAVSHSPRRSPFASSSESPRRSPFAAPFAIRRAVRHSPRHSLRHSPRRFLFIFAIQTSLFNVRRAVSHSQFANRRAIRHSPRHSLSLFNVPWRFP